MGKYLIFILTLDDVANSISLSISTLPIIRSGGRFRRDQRQMEEEEEMWFNEEDDFTEIDSYNNDMKSE